MLIAMPQSSPSSPFTRLAFRQGAIVVRPSTVSQKYSCGPKRNENFRQHPRRSSYSTRTPTAPPNTRACQSREHSFRGPAPAGPWESRRRVVGRAEVGARYIQAG